MVCGIYSITNRINGKKYFGSSLNVWVRKRQHIYSLRRGTHRNKHLQAAWNKYGELKFAFALVEEVSENELLAVEQKYLDQNCLGYNLSKCAESAARGIKWTEEAKRRFGMVRRGKPLSESHKKALSLASLGRKKTPAQIEAMRLCMTGKSVDGKSRKKIAETLRSMWQDPSYRARMTSAQASGKSTDKAKNNYSSASLTMWANPDFKAKMNAKRKSRWSDPEYRLKMIKVRKMQGLRLREKNSERKKYALS